MWFDSSYIEQYKLDILSLEGIKKIEEIIIPDMLENFWDNENAPELLQQFLGKWGRLTSKELNKLYELSPNNPIYKESYTFYNDAYPYSEEIFYHAQKLREQNSEWNNED